MRLLSQTPLIQQNHRVLPHPFSTGFRFQPVASNPCKCSMPCNCSQNETEFSATLPNRHLPTPPKTHPRRRPSAHHIGPLSTSHSISSQQTPVTSLPKGSTQSRHPRFLSLLFSFSLFSLLPVAPSALVEPTKREPYHQKCLFLNK